jgi:hypothetical protein
VLSRSDRFFRSAFPVTPHAGGACQKQIRGKIYSFGNRGSVLPPVPPLRTVREGFHLTRP